MASGIRPVLSLMSSSESLTDDFEGVIEIHSDEEDGKERERAQPLRDPEEEGAFPPLACPWPSCSNHPCFSLLIFESGRLAE